MSLVDANIAASSTHNEVHLMFRARCGENTVRAHACYRVLDKLHLRIMKRANVLIIQDSSLIGSQFLLNITEAGGNTYSTTEILFGSEQRPVSLYEIRIREVWEIPVPLPVPGALSSM